MENLASFYNKWCNLTMVSLHSYVVYKYSSRSSSFFPASFNFSAEEPHLWLFSQCWQELKIQVVPCKFWTMLGRWLRFQVVNIFLDPIHLSALSLVTPFLCANFYAWAFHHTVPAVRIHLIPGLSSSEPHIISCQTSISAHKFIHSDRFSSPLRFFFFW